MSGASGSNSVNATHPTTSFSDASATTTPAPTASSVSATSTTTAVTTSSVAASSSSTTATSATAAPIPVVPTRALSTRSLEIDSKLSSSQPNSYGTNDIHTIMIQAADPLPPVTQAYAPTYGVSYSRARSNSDTAPWDDHDGGGLATYLPAPPSPRTPVPGGTGRRRRVGGTESPINGAGAPGGGKRTPALQIPPPLGLNVNGHGIQSDSPKTTTPLLGADSQQQHTSSAAAAAAMSRSPPGDEIHVDDFSFDENSRPANSSSFSHPATEMSVDGHEIAGVMEEGGDDEVDDTDDNIPSYQPPPVSHSHKLGQWMATGICGNDITSSCLYVTGLVVADAGIWAPICLLMVVGTLYLFRKVYGEAVTALPLNGGAYNVLLNTTSKSTAAVAACLTILSYVATAVVSGSEAVHYLHILWNDLPVTLGTIVLLSIFAFLNLMGITDSARVAFTIFALHMTTMTLLAVVVIIYIGQHGFDLLSDNYSWGQQPVLWRSILYGFSSAMLGVSGFESSANFVEEQKSGVFVKTLRNMWVCVSIFNPLLAFLALCVLKQEYIVQPDNQPTVLAEMGRVAAGPWLEKLVSADAFLVLSGGVLTSFVGVTGLCRRLALDRCLPQLLLAENEWRHTNHWIILGFLGICCSMYLILNGDVDSLANVYSVSFMSVMGLFAVGNMLLKYKRGKLKREVTAPWPQVILALIMVTLALCGLLAKDASILVVWCLYFFVTGGLVATMFFRIQTLKILYSASRSLCGKRNPRCLDAIARTIKNIGGQSVAFFAKSGKLSVLNKAVLYVRNNEDCAWIRIIHVYESQDKIPPKLLRNVNILDEEYPKLKIDLVLVPGVFSPDVIDYLSQQLRIPKNLMFITCPKEDFTHKIETLGGVRLITH